MASPDDLSELDEQVDYYALLNIPRTATREQVKSAYTQLARALHPDKQQAYITENGEESKDIAEAVSRHDEQQVNDMFILVDRAYKVLSDDVERRVYDEFGVVGLEELKAVQQKKGKLGRQNRWLAEQLTSHDEHGANIRNKVFRRMVMHNEAVQMETFKSRGALKLDFDVSENVAGLGDLYLGSILSLPVFQQMMVQQAIDIPVSSRDVIFTNAYIVTRGGMGVGNATVGWKRDFSKVTSGVATMTLAPLSQRNPCVMPYCSIKGQRILSQHAKGELEFIVHNMGESTGMQVTVNRSLSTNTNGTLVYGFGSESGVSVEINRQAHHRAQVGKRKPRNWMSPPTNDNPTTGPEHNQRNDDQLGDMLFTNTSAGLHVNEGGFGVDASMHKAFTKESRGKLSLRLHSSAMEVELSSSRSLGGQSTANMALTVGLAGVTLKFRYSRGGLRFVVPLVLSSQPTSTSLVVGGVVPMIVNYLVRRLLGPFERRRKVREFVQQQAVLSNERKRARTQRQMMTYSSESRKRKEISENGLVVLSARYGARLNESWGWDYQVPDPIDVPLDVDERPRVASDWDEYAEQEAVNDRVRENLSDQLERRALQQHPSNIDVTLQLNFFLKDSEIVLPSSSKATMLGFYDPCYGQDGVEPELFVRYSFAGQVFEIVASDTEPLTLPSPNAVHVGRTDMPVAWGER